MILTTLTHFAFLVAGIFIGLHTPPQMPQLPEGKQYVHRIDIVDKN